MLPQSKPSQRRSATIASDELGLLGGRVGVVEAQVAGAVVLLGDTEVEADRLRVADVEIAVGLGRKASDDAAAVLAGSEVGGDDARMKSFRTERSSGAATDPLLEFPGARQSIGPRPGALEALGHAIGRPAPCGGARASGL